MERQGKRPSHVIGGRADDQSPLQLSDIPRASRTAEIRCSNDEHPLHSQPILGVVTTDGRIVTKREIIDFLSDDKVEAVCHSCRIEPRWTLSAAQIREQIAVAVDKRPHYIKAGDVGVAVRARPRRTGARVQPPK